jgi:AcrR family transcriptional regulator
MTTQERILEAARGQFNKVGVDNVSARTICAELGISPGNFTYYYSNKNEIIADLFKKMTAENYTVFVSMSEKEASILTYLEAHNQMFLIQEKYKFFYLNLFEILTNNPEVKANYLNQAKAELKMAREMLHLYVDKGILITGIKDEQFERMVNEGRILNNSWLVDAELLYKSNQKRKLHYYMGICCGLIEPYLTSNASKDYKEFFKNLLK